MLSNIVGTNGLEVTLGKCSGASKGSFETIWFTPNAWFSTVDEKEKIVVWFLEAQTLEMNLSPKTPYHIKIDCMQFPIGFAQRAIA
jgi:hypothetical protein